MSNNIPVNGWPQLKDLEAVQPILNRLDKIEAWKRTVKEETFTGDDITIENALALPARSLITSINAIQDLHGYDKPWAGGVGKNKLEYPYVTASSTINGVTFTVNSDGTVKANGTATANCNFVLSNKARLDKFASGTYIMNGCPAGGADDGSTYFMGFYAPNKSAYDFGSGTNISLSGNEDQSANIYIRIANGYTANNLIFLPMIRLSTESDASFAPYSNICPISGRTETRVDDVGVNIWDEQWRNGYYDLFTGAFVSLATAVASKNPTAVQGNTTYRFVTSTTGNYSICFYDSDNNFISSSRAAGSKNFTTPANAAYLQFNYDASPYGDTYKNDTAINYPSTFTDYVPYAHSSATIQLGTTIYGADINWDTGVATVNRKTISLSGDSTGSIVWEAFTLVVADGKDLTDAPAKCSHLVRIANLDMYNSIGTDNYNTAFSTASSSGTGQMIRLRNRLLSAQTADAYKAWFADELTKGTPVQVCYELATPTTIQLTPEQLEMLKGYNHITLSDGYGTIELKALTGANWS